MKKFIIKGPTKPISGLVNVSGAKNSCLPLIASSILFNDQVVLKNVSFVQDVYTMLNLIKSLGSKVYISEKKKLVKIVNSKVRKLFVPYKLVSTMRAGVLTMGPLLSRYQNKKIFVAKGGGCSIGIRDINYHLSAFESLKAKHTLSKGYVKIFSANGLKGSNYRFPKITVTGTSNIIMASIFAKGIHTIRNISIEPEVLDLINFLNKSGAKIKFVGGRTIKIEGIKKLTKGEHTIIGDRIEAFSYLCVALITKGKILVRNINPKFLSAELKTLQKIGCKIKLSKNSIFLQSLNKHKPVKIKTGPFPGYATDNMPIILAVMSKISGRSEIEETIFSNRFMAAPELSRMGAKIKIKKNKAIIYGENRLFGADCISSDLRTTFSIILGALAAEGTSKVQRIYHGLRGYYNLKTKLKKIGINIRVLN